MKPRAFAALAAVTLVAVTVAIATYVSQNRWSQAKVSGAALLPDLAAQASRISRVGLQQGDKALALARSDEGWTLADRGGGSGAVATKALRETVRSRQELRR